MKLRGALSLIIIGIWAVQSQQVGNTQFVAPASAPSQDTDAASNVMNLSQIARSNPDGFSTCVFDFQVPKKIKLAHFSGSSSSSSSQVTTASIDASSNAGSGLSKANISCQGSSNIVLQGGPALAKYAGNWKGVTFIQNIQLPGSTMTFRGVKMVIKDSNFNGLQSFGSGALAFAQSNLTVLNSTFFNNNNSAAGCIYVNESSSVQLLDSNFTNNFGLQAGVVATWNSSLIVNNTLFSNNSCNSQGGALYVNNGSTIVILDSTFNNCSATNGGAVYLETCNVAVLEQNVFMMNSVSKSGGAVFQLKCPGSYLSNTFARNSGQNGGAIWHNNLRSLNHTLNLFIQNTAINGSGGIELNQVAQMVVNGCNFTSNRGQKGGAIYSQDVTGSTSGSFFGFNQVTTNGGALFRGTSTGDVSGNTFLNNTANLDGGAIYESHVDGNINDNIFQLPATGNNIRGVFRTICSGSVTNNTGLISSQIANQNPVNADLILILSSLVEFNDGYFKKHQEASLRFKIPGYTYCDVF